MAARVRLQGQVGQAVRKKLLVVVKFIKMALGQLLVAQVLGLLVQAVKV